MKRQTLLSIALIISLGLSAQDRLNIGWDTSSSMEDRVLTAELAYLNNYFIEHPNVKVKLFAFNNVVIKTTSFEVIDGKWEVLMDQLRNVNYDGATSYTLLSEHENSHKWLLFTDGLETISGEVAIQDNCTVVNANKHYNQQKLLELSGGEHAQLIHLIDVEDRVDVLAPDDRLTYIGNVFSENAKPEDIKISVKNKNNATVAKKDGTFSIKAVPGDTLIFKTPNNIPIEKIATTDRTLNVWIKMAGIELDQVDLKREKEEPTEFANIGYQKVDKRTLGYAVQSVSAEDINAGGGDMKTVMQGKFSGVKKGINQDFSLSAIRQANITLFKNYPLIMIDGAPIPKSVVDVDGAYVAITNFIDPNNIADVSILKGLAATNQYGSEGVGGVILITTKQAYNQRSGQPVTNTALLKNNIYEENIISNNKVFKAAYIDELQQHTTVGDAYKTYLSQRKNYWEEPAYFIDVYEFFNSTNEQLASQIAYNLIEWEDSSLSALRGMLFKANTEKNYGLALNIARHLVAKFPQQTQSYLDLALATKNVDDFQGALNMLTSIANGSMNPDLDFSALHKITDNEIRNLVATKKGELDLSGIDVRHLKKEAMDARIVFDWSNPDAEFELQFVNPGKRYFKWEHTLNAPERIEDELLKGYSQEEFEIDGGEKGKWLINVKYLGNRTEGNTAPTFLKCIVQRNYGKPNETTEEHIIRLYEKGSEELAVELFTQ